MKGTALGLCLLIFALTGCHERSDLDRLVTSSADAFTGAAQYYDRLGAITVEAWQIQIAFLSLAGASPSAEDQSAFQERLTALERRSRVAQALAKTYIAIGSLRSPGGSDAVASAGQNLGAALGGIPNLPGASVAATAAIGKVAEFLVGLKRNSDSRKALASLSQADAFQNDLFSREQSVYIAIEVDRDGTADRLLRQLANAKLVKLSSFLRLLHLGVPPEAFQDDERIRAIELSAASVALFRKKAAWTCATQNTAGALEIAAAQTKDLVTPDVSALDRLDQKIVEAKTCLADYQNLDSDK